MRARGNDVRRIDHPFVCTIVTCTCICIGVRKLCEGGGALTMRAEHARKVIASPLSKSRQDSRILQIGHATYVRN